MEPNAAQKLKNYKLRHNFALANNKRGKTTLENCENLLGVQVVENRELNDHRGAARSLLLSPGPTHLTHMHSHAFPTLECRDFYHANDSAFRRSSLRCLAWERALLNIYKSASENCIVTQIWLSPPLEFTRWQKVIVNLLPFVLGSQKKEVPRNRNLSIKLSGEFLTMGAREKQQTNKTVPAWDANFPGVSTHNFSSQLAVHCLRCGFQFSSTVSHYRSGNNACSPLPLRYIFLLFFFLLLFSGSSF